MLVKVAKEAYYQYHLVKKCLLFKVSFIMNGFELCFVYNFPKWQAKSAEIWQHCSSQVSCYSPIFKSEIQHQNIQLHAWAGVDGMFESNTNMCIIIYGIVSCYISWSSKNLTKILVSVNVNSFCPYAVRSSDQYCFRLWLNAWWHQVIIWTKVNIKSIRFSDIYSRVLSTGILNHQLVLLWNLHIWNRSHIFQGTMSSIWNCQCCPCTGLNPKPGQYCACWWPGTWWCWAISKHSIDCYIKAILRALIKMSISEHFNDFFINIGPNLAKLIPHVKKVPMAYMGDVVQVTIFLEPVTCDEISTIVSNLENNATGFDEISAVYLKMSLSSIASPLVYICNMSLSEGVFPTQLKMANVVPLYKCVDPMMFNHYRPVSLLCTLSKVFEKVMYNRLIKFLQKFSVLYEYQFGFRRKRSTHLALITLIDQLTQAIENGEYVIGVFLDFSKAFDTVDHKILLDKLYHYGVRGCAHKWFTSYLTGREQFVTYNGVKSHNQFIKCGVPQGSILGPLLFLLYINDLASVCQYTFPILFADDSNLFIGGNDADLTMETLNTELKEISIWLKANKLTLNIKKTHFMIFSSKNKPHPDMNINIDGEIINETSKTKFLGVIIDNKLSWKDHILYISGKLARGTGVILKARKYLMKETLISLYYSFVYPYLIYCNHVWGLACKTYMNTLFLLQKRIIRIIAGVNRRSHTDPIFKGLKLLKCNDISSYLIGRL